MDKKGVISKMRQMSIEEKIALLSEKEEAYIRGFIEGTLFWSYGSQTDQKPKTMHRKTGASSKD